MRKQFQQSLCGELCIPYRRSPGGSCLDPVHIWSWGDCNCLVHWHGAETMDFLPKCCPRRSEWCVPRMRIAWGTGSAVTDWSWSFPPSPGHLAGWYRRDWGVSPGATLCLDAFRWTWAHATGNSSLRAAGGWERPSGAPSQPRGPQRWH